MTVRGHSDNFEIIEIPRPGGGKMVFTGQLIERRTEHIVRNDIVKTDYFEIVSLYALPEPESGMIMIQKGDTAESAVLFDFWTGHLPDLARSYFPPHQ